METSPLIRSSTHLLCKPQRKDYLLINAFQTGSSEEYLITKSYRKALVVEQRASQMKAIGGATGVVSEAADKTQSNRLLGMSTSASLIESKWLLSDGRSPGGFQSETIPRGTRWILMNDHTMSA